MNLSPVPDVVKKGDSPTLYYRANADLSTATTIKLHIAKSADTAAIVSRDAVVDEVDANGHSILRVDLTSADTSTVGTYVVEIEATVSGKKVTFPSDGYLRLRVVDDLA
jgi:hypothetical protein